MMAAPPDAVNPKAANLGLIYMLNSELVELQYAHQCFEAIVSWAAHV
jgi:hypothetical protein